MTTMKEKEKEEAREYLLELLKPSNTVYTVLRHVSRSGMFRVISLHIMREGQPYDISWQAAELLEGYSDKYNGCKVSGCGMDMGFHLVYNLSYSLFPKGFQCCGSGEYGRVEYAYCPSNDHNNKPYPKRDSKMWHIEGGYALIQRWM